MRHLNLLQRDLTWTKRPLGYMTTCLQPSMYNLTLLASIQKRQSRMCKLSGAKSPAGQQVKAHNETTHKQRKFLQIKNKNNVWFWWIKIREWEAFKRCPLVLLKMLEGIVCLWELWFFFFLKTIGFQPFKITCLKGPVCKI